MTRALLEHDHNCSSHYHARAKCDCSLSPPKPKPDTQPVQPSCWCARCDRESNTFQTRMAICPLCGDKRCPRAKDHRNDCARKAPYDQTALELCETCGWKTLIPGEGCLNCERKAVQPAWHDAPNAPGLWVSIDRYNQYDWHLFRDPMTYPLDQSWVDKSRYFGPIPLPEDRK